MAARRFPSVIARPCSCVLLLAATIVAVGASVAGEFAMATGDKLQWSPDGVGHFRPMELDPRDPTGNPWLFGEQFREPESSRLPWRQQPTVTQGVSEHFEPRPWGEQGRRDRYRDDPEREHLRSLRSSTPATPRAGEGRYEYQQQRFDLTPRPATLTRPLSVPTDYAVESAARHAEGWGYDALPW